MEIVKYGIIGLGNIGTTHVNNFMKEGNVPNAKVTAIADLKKFKIDNICSKYPEANFECYDSGEDLIENAEVDAVIVAVPHYDHPRLCIMALKKGLNVICEKPAGVYTKQVKEMNEVAATSKGLFAMMFNQRTNCLYRKMKELISNGEIGQIKRINWIITDWYRSQSYYDSGDWRATWSGEGGGVLFNQCPHQLDLLSWVTGMMPKRVHAFCHYGKWHEIEVEDDVTAYLEYENGATGVFITSTADAPGTNRFEVLGTGGKIVAEYGKLMLYKNEIDERENDKNKFFEMLHEIKNDCLKGPEIIYINGQSGQGKTYGAYKIALEQFNIEQIGKITCKNDFIDIVNDEAECFVIEEFRPSQIKASDFLQLTDKYGYRCNVKGTFKTLRPKMIIICSIIPPNQVYTNEEINVQFLRRITKIIEK